MTIPISECAERITLTVKLTGVKRFKVRVAAAVVLLRLAAWVAPFKVTIVDDRER